MPMNKKLSKILVKKREPGYSYRWLFSTQLLKFQTNYDNNVVNYSHSKS